MTPRRLYILALLIVSAFVTWCLLFPICGECGEVPPRELEPVWGV